jgi:outer membrane protein W
MKKLIYALVALLALCKYAQAQNTNTSMERFFGSEMFFVGYEVAVPTNSNYLTNTSWSGMRFEYQHMFRDNVSFGIGVSFNAFDQYFTTQTYQLKNGSGAVTGDMIRQVYTTPITASLHYYMQGGKTIRPYVGLGLGTEYSEQNVYFNIYGAESNNWGFVVRPEIGLLAKFNYDVGGFLGVAYNYSTNKNDAFNISHLSQIPITIGVVFSPR